MPTWRGRASAGRKRPAPDAAEEPPPVARRGRKAAAWAAERGIPKSYGSYQALLDDPAVEVVYIPLPTTLHVEWVHKACAAGKHVLIEKPVGLDAAAVAGMVRAAAAAGVQIMDAVHWMHNPRTAAFMDVVRGGEIGARRRVNCSFCFPGHRREGFFTENIRSQADADPLGALGDLGWCKRTAQQPCGYYTVYLYRATPALMVLCKVSHARHPLPSLLPSFPVSLPPTYLPPSILPSLLPCLPSHLIQCWPGRHDPRNPGGDGLGDAERRHCDRHNDGQRD